MATQKTATSKVAAKTTSTKASSTTTVKAKTSAPKTQTAKTVAPKAELYIVNGAKKLDAAHAFKKAVSPIYGVDEFSWKGKLEKGAVKFIRKDGKSVPTNDIYNSGYTLIGKAMNLFHVKNALVEHSHTSEDQCYNYGNPKTVLEYVGDDKTHTIYVRIYDNAQGEANDRWVTISID